MMNLQKKPFLIELGGQQIATSSIKLMGSICSPSKAMPPLPSKEVIQSSHRLPLKLSPKKYQIQSYHGKNKSGAFQNDQSFNDLQLSKLSIKNKVTESRTFLGDRSNANVSSPSKITIRYNDSQRNSPASSRTSSIHARPVIASPLKQQPVVLQISPREIELERKLKILEGRIVELHKEKQEAVGRLNEQNRKIYHENTSLKLKINELSKRMERTEFFENSAKIERTQSIYQNNVVLENARLEVEHLKKQIQKLSTELTEQTTKLTYLATANSELSAELARITEICSNQKLEIQSLKNSNDGQEQIQHLKKEIFQKEEELERVKSCSKQWQNQVNEWRLAKQIQNADFENIKAKLQQNEKRYQVILHQYQSKIHEYEHAYNQNQALIKELEEQIKTYEAQSIIKQEPMEESDAHNELESECLELENNFSQAIQEREALIISLQAQKRELESKYQKQTEQIEELWLSDEDKNKKLQQASILLEKMTSKFQQISQRYSELTQRYELQKNKMNKSEGFQSKCKKCQELLKTVLRLNSQLNPKRSV